MLLGMGHEKGNHPGLEKSLGKLIARKPSYTPTPIFLVTLRLKLAEALSWQQDFTGAREVLGKIPAEILAAEPELKLQEQLLRAEILMREKTDPREILADGLLKAVKESKNPDLLTRLIGDIIEAHFYKKALD